MSWFWSKKSSSSLTFFDSLKLLLYQGFFFRLSRQPMGLLAPTAPESLRLFASCWGFCEKRREKLHCLAEIPGRMLWNCHEFWHIFGMSVSKIPPVWILLDVTASLYGLWPRITALGCYPLILQICRCFRCSGCFAFQLY